MIWKPKEKEYTMEEAVEIAKKELANYWHGLTPQIVGIKTENGYTVVPLEPSFSKKSWLLFFIDPTDFSGQAAEIYSKEWYRRYHGHDMIILLVLVPTYRYCTTRDNIREFIDQRQIHFPIVVDADRTLGAAFGASHPPKISLLKEGHQFLEYSGSTWLRNTELNIQDFLRAKDPGLALLDVFQPEFTIIEDKGRVEFGFSPQLGKELNYEKPGFIPSPKGFRVGRFHGLRPSMIPPGEVFIEGDWLQDGDRIITQDPHAFIVFNSIGTHFAIVAESLSKTIEDPMIMIEVNGSPGYESIAGSDIVLEETGASVVKLRKARLYNVFQNLPPEPVEITLKFPTASVAPLALYGLRFGVVAEQ